ncbi:MAG: hypothetical protein HKN59_06355, partial [Gammaproteobacteria bacterium]|nr:hypothetical protein [Gammaproteobacteria bacterium]
MNDAPTNSRKTGPALRRLWRWIAGSFAGLVIILAVALGLFRLMLPQIPAYHAQIEDWASKAVGLPVKLGRLDARWSFGGPELTFKNARLFARDTNDLLIEAAEGSVGINLGELFREGRIQPGKVALVGTRLSLERNAEGILHLTGQTPPSGGARRAMAPVFQVLPRGAFEFRDAAVLYVDRAAGHGPWRFSDVNLSIDYGRSALQIEGSARLPASLGEYAEFKLGTTDALTNPLSIRWQGSVRLQQIDLAGVGEVLPQKFPEILDGSADIIANFGMIGRDLQHVSANVLLREFVFGRSDELPHGFTQIGGLIEWSREASGWKAAASNFLIERNGYLWPETRITAERTLSSNEAVEIVYLDAGFLRLEDLRPLMHWLPPGEVVDKLSALSPAGELRGLVVSHSLRDGALASFSVRSDFKDFSLQADGALPGATGLAGKLRMDDAGGVLELDAGSSQLLVPAFFDKPLPLNALKTSLSWQKSTDGWQVESDNVELDTQAFVLGGSFSLALPAADASPVLNLEAQVKDLELLAARDFLPEKKMPAAAYRWLYGALVSGEAPETTISFNGPLRAYPFPNGEGLFRARTIIEDMRFAFARDWPAIEGARLEVVLENAAYKGRIISGTISGNDVAGSTANIANLADPILIMNGQARGTLTDLLRFMRSSPVARVMGPRLLDVRGSGGAQTDVVLNLPLLNLADFRLNGNTSIQAEWLGLAGLEQRLTRLNGELNFTEKTVRANDIDAMLFGRPVKLDIRPGSDASGAITSTLVELRGRHSSTNLVGNLPFPVQVVMDGETDWQAVARLPSGGSSGERFSVEVSSALTGMAISLPDPVFKPAEESRRFTADIAFPQDGEISMRTRLGNAFTGFSRFSKDRGTWRHERSAVGLGESIENLPATEGLVVSGAVDALAIDDWIEVDWQT